MIQHVFIVGAKSLGAYGGYETFVDKLTEYQQDCHKIKYHIACKANGDGHMDEKELLGVKQINSLEFEYHNAHCFKILIPKIGSAQAIYYDLKALDFCCNYIRKNAIKNPIIYILACRIGPFMGYYQNKIQRLGGKVFVNPDGHEWKRAKWSAPIRKYWKKSEQLMVKHCDLLVCDSIHIENYIKSEYKKYSPKTTYISYGTEVRKSYLKDNHKKIVDWYKLHNLRKKEYYLVVGRFVPENNYEIMIKEFMKSNTKKDLVLITNVNEKLFNELENKLHFKKDQRIKFVGTVYDKELLMKIREDAFAYFHGHEVGGTNPSLLEALGSTDLNLLLDVGFNKEVAKDSALYWKKDPNDLSCLISKADNLTLEEIEVFKEKARTRIKNSYSWEFISNLYLNLFINYFKGGEIK